MQAATTFLRSLEESVSSGEGRTYERITTSSCTCRELLKTLAQQKAAGLEVKDFVLDIDSVRARSINNRVARVAARYEHGPYRVVNSDGVVTSEVDARSFESDLLLQKTSAGWLVAKAVLLS